MNQNNAGTFSRDIESGIEDYLRRVTAALRSSGHSEMGRASVLEDLEHQIRAEVGRLQRPSREDLIRILSAIDPPEAFGESAAQNSPTPTTKRNPTLVAVSALVLLAVLAAWAWSRQKDATVSAQEYAAPAPAESKVAEIPPAPPSDPVVLPQELAVAAPSDIAIAVAEFAASGNLADSEAVRTVIADGLVNAMAMANGVRVVERSRLKEALGELKLGAEGLVSTATALELGKLTGARIILTGNIARLGDQLILTARLINAETGELSAVRVTGDRAELLAMVDDLGQQVLQRIAKDEKGVLARADDSARAQLREKQKALKAAIAGRTLPRVLVLIPETHLARRIPDPAAETELVLWLTDAGFQVASPEYEGIHSPTPTPALTDETEIQFRRHRAFGEMEGLINISRQVLNQLLQPGLVEQRDALMKVADVMILGEGISERGTEREGLISCKARVELKAIDIKSGRVLLAKSDYGSGIDVAEHIAGKRALQAAARQMAPDLIVEILNAWPHE